MVCMPLGLDVTVPQAYALVGVAGMLASVCQVCARSVAPQILALLPLLLGLKSRMDMLHKPGVAPAFMGGRSEYHS